MTSPKKKLSIYSPLPMLLSVLVGCTSKWKSMSPTEPSQNVTEFILVKPSAIDRSINKSPPRCIVRGAQATTAVRRSVLQLVERNIIQSKRIVAAFTYNDNNTISYHARRPSRRLAKSESLVSMDIRASIGVIYVDYANSDDTYCVTPIYDSSGMLTKVAFDRVGGTAE